MNGFQLSVTLGEEIEVQEHQEMPMKGVATDIDEDGNLLVRIQMDS